MLCLDSLWLIQQSIPLKELPLQYFSRLHLCPYEIKVPQGALCQAGDQGCHGHCCNFSRVHLCPLSDRGVAMTSPGSSCALLAARITQFSNFCKVPQDFQDCIAWAEAASAGLPGQDCKGKIARAGQEGDDSQKRTARTGQPTRDCNYENENEKWYLHLTFILLKTSLFPLPSGFGLWNRVFSAVKQREEKTQNNVFFLLRSALSSFFAPTSMNYDFWRVHFMAKYLICSVTLWMISLQD